MEGISDRRGGRIFTDLPRRTILAVSVGSPLESAVSRTRPRQRCQRYGWSRSTRTNNAARQPGRAHLCGWGVLNRPVPRSPSSRAQALGRRGEAQASKRSREPREARVFVLKHREAEVG